MIPQKLAQIWVGPINKPKLWMDTWKKFHPNWEYRVLDNEYLLGRKWRCHRQISHYLRWGRIEGVADIMRYEYLFENGGVMPEADSICVQPIDKLFHDGEIYAVYENEVARPGFCSPYIAATSGHKVLKFVINTIRKTEPEKLERPWISTGNRLLKVIHKRRGFVEDGTVRTLPSHSFNAGSREDPNSAVEEGVSYPDDVYAIQMWGTSTDGYKQFDDRYSKEFMKQECIKLADEFDAAMVKLG